MTRWLLKTVAADGAAHGGFVWPLEVGAEVAAPDWSDAPKCGGGLHGLLDGRGDGGLLSWSPDAVWLVAEVPADAHLVDLDGKVKVDRCVVAHVGDQASAIGFLADQGVVDGVVGAHVVAGYRGTATAGDSGTVTAGDYGTATAGDSGTATAGDYGTATAGDYGTATAGDYGTAIAGDSGTATAEDSGTATAGDSGTVTAGDYGTVTAGDYGTAIAGYYGTAIAGYYGTATAGYYGTATAGYSGTATAGYRGTATAGDYGTVTAGERGTATAGYGGTATAGDYGTIVLAWWDDKLARRRWVVGEVGIDGIKADTPYRCDAGRLEEAQS